MAGSNELLNVRVLKSQLFNARLNLRDAHKHYIYRRLSGSIHKKGKHLS